MMNRQGGGGRCRAGIWSGHSGKSSEETEGRSSPDGRGWKLSLQNLLGRVRPQCSVVQTGGGRQQLEELPHSPRLVSKELDVLHLNQNTRLETRFLGSSPTSATSQRCDSEEVT